MQDSTRPMAISCGGVNCNNMPFWCWLLWFCLFMVHCNLCFVFSQPLCIFKSSASIDNGWCHVTDKLTLHKLHAYACSASAAGGFRLRQEFACLLSVIWKNHAQYMYTRVSVTLFDQTAALQPLKHRNSHLSRQLSCCCSLNFHAKLN